MPGLTTQWIYRGTPLPGRPDRHIGNDDALIHVDGLVRISNSRAGTEVRWAAASPCFSSLYYAACRIEELRGPFMLRYFLAGWFEENLATAREAANRIHEIVSRSDIHILNRTFVREYDPAGMPLPEPLRAAWFDGVADSQYSVDCVFEESSGRFRVSWIGPQSTIARLWGSAPVSYPCQPGGSYDRTVSAAYAGVLHSGRPRYDQVYAAMMTPERELVWIPYHRVILPSRNCDPGRGVSVVSEVGMVDFRIV